MDDTINPDDRTMKIGKTTYRLPTDVEHPPLMVDPVKQAERAAEMARHVEELLANSDGKKHCQVCMKFRPPARTQTHFTCPECGQGYHLDGCWPGTCWEADEPEIGEPQT